MKREWLKELGLEAEVIDKIMDENGKDVNKAKGETQTLKTENADLKQQLATANTTITELKASNTNNEALQAKVTEYEQTIETMKADNQKKEFDLALENELIKLNVHSTKAARAELDMDKIAYENGQFTGLKEQTDKWAQEKAFLIKTGLLIRITIQQVVVTLIQKDMLHKLLHKEIVAQNKHNYKTILMRMHGVKKEVNLNVLQRN